MNTAQEYLDVERTMTEVRNAVVEAIRAGSKNPAMTDRLIAWISTQRCEPSESVCGYEIPADAAAMIARVKAVATAWIAAGKP